MSKLYRFISFENFVDIIQRKELTFVRPELWEDPCESYILKALRNDEIRKEFDVRVNNQSYIYRYKGSFLNFIGKQYYGQCWTTKSESDAFWRIYSHDKKAVRIEISTDDLDYLKYKQQNVIHKPVYYTNNISLESEIERVFRQGTTYTLNVFLTKREAFKHEKEYRIMAYNPIENSGDLIHLSFKNINGFIKSVMLHPQAPDWFNTTLSNYCKINKLFYIGRSKLYDEVFK